MRKIHKILPVLFVSTALLIAGCGKTNGTMSEEASERESGLVEQAKNATYPYSWKRNSDGTLNLKFEGDWAEGSIFLTENTAEDVVSFEKEGEKTGKKKELTYLVTPLNEGFATAYVYESLEGLPKDAFYQTYITFYVNNNLTIEIFDTGVVEPSLIALGDGTVYTQMVSEADGSATIYLYDGSAILEEAEESETDAQDEQEDAVETENTDAAVEEETEEVSEEVSEDEQTETEAPVDYDSDEPSDDIPEEDEDEEGPEIFDEGTSAIPELFEQEWEIDFDNTDGFTFTGPTAINGGYQISITAESAGESTLTMMNEKLGITVTYQIVIEEVSNETDSEENSEDTESVGTSLVVRITLVQPEAETVEE